MDASLLLAFVGIVIVIFAIQYVLKQQRRKALMQKYGDKYIVDMIMNRQIWQGMHKEQIIESWGPPEAKDQHIYKTKTSETFKYRKTGKNRFVYRVMLENDYVVGWKENKNQ
ncbi:DUF2845 domain-containing protein [Azorhizobium doebereinerae]|uniref:DUF2845 domain-containing protein n=1 Tax=Azorhizobium doebereinerae TaxID=281091 RepID=UPI0012EB9158|nr:DUF2845 domain-containing protein [Azorhizobium doebereinerae]